MVKLECKSPVPSDIDIAQAATPVHIAEIAKAVGLSPEEYDLYGTTKAKVGSVMLVQALCLLSNANDCVPSLPGHQQQLSSLQVKLDVIKKNASSSNGNYGTAMLSTRLCTTFHSLCSFNLSCCTETYLLLQS